jgi:hypothetical protein
VCAQASMAPRVRRSSVFTFAPKKSSEGASLFRPRFTLNGVPTTSSIRPRNKHLSSRTFLDRTKKFSCMKIFSKNGKNVIFSGPLPSGCKKHYVTMKPKALMKPTKLDAQKLDYKKLLVMEKFIRSELQWIEFSMIQHLRVVISNCILLHFNVWKNALQRSKNIAILSHKLLKVSKSDI